MTTTETRLSHRTFPPTHWSLVLAAGHSSASGAQPALESLCRTYWPPLYAYVRRQGQSPADAEDITQEFFARFLAQDSFQKADPHQGRFRTFLLAALQRFLVSEWRKKSRQKRGGGICPLPWDTAGAEEHYAAQLADAMTPELAYERNWATALMDRVLDRLGEEYATAGHSLQFDLLKESVWGSKEVGPYAEIASALEQTEEAVKKAVQRLRQRCRELLREEVAQTVTRTEDIDEELRHLISVLRG